MHRQYIDVYVLDDFRSRTFNNTDTLDIVGKQGTSSLRLTIEADVVTVNAEKANYNMVVKPET